MFWLFETKFIYLIQVDKHWNVFSLLKNFNPVVSVFYIDSFQNGPQNKDSLLRFRRCSLNQISKIIIE